MYKIEKGVKMMKKAYDKYPFSDMKVGDSFVLNNADRTKVSSASAAYQRRQKPVQKFSIRAIDSDNCRCYRVA